MRRTAFVVHGLAATLFFCGCTVGPDYQKPETPMPDVWEQKLTRGLAGGESTLETWWTVFNDPILTELIERAREGNLDLATALARIDEAAAGLGIASGERFPIVDAAGSVSRGRLSEATNPFVFGNRSRTDNDYSIGLDASWEVDLFGRIRRSVESADAGLQASVETYRDVLVVLLAEVAATYTDVRTFQERLRYAESNVTAQDGTRQLTQDRFNANIVPELDVRQAELNLASTESVVPALRQAVAQAVNRLSVLIGERPSALRDLLEQDGPIPSVPQEVVVGLPTELLRQRPDIRAAERSLASQNALVGVATAELYPRLSLLGSFGYESFKSTDLLQGGSRVWSMGPAVSWNIFDGSRIRSNIRAEDARTAQALAQYEQTVLLALEDVESSMVAFVEEQERRDALKRSVVAASRSVELVMTLYRTGLTDFQNVLDNQRSLFAQQDLLAESEGLIVRNLIGLYRALGGGWSQEPMEEELENAENSGAAESDDPQ